MLPVHSRPEIYTYANVYLLQMYDNLFYFGYFAFSPALPFTDFREYVSSDCLNGSCQALL